MVSSHQNNLATGALLRRGVLLERLTLTWNLVGVVVLAVAAIYSRSIALAGFGLDSAIEIFASAVVLWELSDSGRGRERRALRLIQIAFIALAMYVTCQSILVLLTNHRADSSPLGILWTALTAGVMFALAAGKATTGRALKNPVLTTEGHVTFIDGLLAVAVLLGLTANAWLGWWWADPVTGLVIVYYAVKEAHNIHDHLNTA